MYVSSAYVVTNRTRNVLLDTRAVAVPRWGTGPQI